MSFINLGGSSGGAGGTTDVVESADFASLPGTGSPAIIYITRDNNKLYRWDGAAYTEIGDGAGVHEVANFASLPGTGAANTIYITADDNKLHRWDGAAYVVISDATSGGSSVASADDLYIYKDTPHEEFDLKNATLVDTGTSAVGVHLDTSIVLELSKTRKAIISENSAQRITIIDIDPSDPTNPTITAGNLYAGSNSYNYPSQFNSIRALALSHSHIATITGTQSSWNGTYSARALTVTTIVDDDYANPTAEEWEFPAEHLIDGHHDIVEVNGEYFLVGEHASDRTNLAVTRVVWNGTTVDRFEYVNTIHNFSTRLSYPTQVENLGPQRFFGEGEYIYFIGDRAVVDTQKSQTVSLTRFKPYELSQTNADYTSRELLLHDAGAGNSIGLGHHIHRMDNGIHLAILVGGVVASTGNNVGNRLLTTVNISGDTLTLADSKVLNDEAGGDYFDMYNCYTHFEGGDWLMFPEAYATVTGPGDWFTTVRGGTIDSSGIITITRTEEDRLTDNWNMTGFSTADGTHFHAHSDGATTNWYRLNSLATGNYRTRVKDRVTKMATLDNIPSPVGTPTYTLTSRTVANSSNEHHIIEINTKYDNRFTGSGKNGGGTNGFNLTFGNEGDWVVLTNQNINVTIEGKISTSVWEDPEVGFKISFSFRSSGVPVIEQRSLEITGSNNYDLDAIEVGYSTTNTTIMITSTQAGGFDAGQIVIIDNITMSTLGTFKDASTINTLVRNLQLVATSSSPSTYFPVKGYIGRGTTANRPTNGLTDGTEYYDTTLKQYIHYNGSEWVEPSAGGGGMGTLLYDIDITGTTESYCDLSTELAAGYRTFFVEISIASDPGNSARNIEFRTLGENGITQLNSFGEINEFTVGVTASNANVPVLVSGSTPAYISRAYPDRPCTAFGTIQFGSDSDAYNNNMTAEFTSNNITTEHNIMKTYIRHNRTSGKVRGFHLYYHIGAALAAGALVNPVNRLRIWGA